MVTTALVGRRNDGIQNDSSANAVDDGARLLSVISTRSATPIPTLAVVDENLQQTLSTTVGQVVPAGVVNAMRTTVSSKRKNAMGHLHDELAEEGA